MQHKFPLCVLHITMDARKVDVNVHPTKMDVRFSDGLDFSRFLSEAVKKELRQREMIPEAGLDSDREEKARERKERREQEKQHTPEPFEKNRIREYRVMEETKYAAEEPKMQDFIQNPVWSRVKNVEKTDMPGKMEKKPAGSGEEEAFFTETSEPDPQGPRESPETGTQEGKQDGRQEGQVSASATQLNLFEEKILTADNRSRFRIIGQVFETYWLVEYEDKLLLIDQHAAHEKVNYERLIKRYREKSVLTQALMPPVIVSLSGQEETVLGEHMDVFAGLGFEIEAFGGSEYALRGVPVDLYGCDERQMFLEVLDQLAEGASFGGIRVIEEKIASMSCKAAVKGNQLLSVPEAEALIDELLTLDNPYNCPHGRPTIVSMTKYEMERKFKRVVS